MSILAMTVLLGATVTQSISQFDSNGVSIRYAVAGQGQPLVLIHGWMGDASTWGRDRSGEPAPRPPAGFQVIVLDCRGHGKSGAPHDAKRYGPEMALDVVRLLDHLKIPKVHLVGYSMGAFIAGHVVAHHAARVQSVIYGGQAPLLRRRDDGGSAEVDAFEKAVKAARLADYIQFVAPETPPDRAELSAKLMFAGKDVQALVAAGKSFPKLAVDARRLERAAVPTLFLYGSKESDRLKVRVEALRVRLPKCEVTEIPGSDHVTALINSAFGKAIVDFVNRHRG